MTLLERYDLEEGSLLLDDSERQRAKKTSKIAKAHKMKAKKTGGYINGQEVVFLVLVTSKVTLPVDFRFYEPDPDMTAWRKERDRLRRQKVPPELRSKKPKPNSSFPKKQSLALDMLKDFSDHFPRFSVKAVLADALYGTKHFMDTASEYFNGIQVVSQLKWNQLVYFRGKKISLKSCFERYLSGGNDTTLVVRGGQEQKVTMRSARLRVKAHDGKLRFIVALKYEGESDYRYLVATDVSWRHQDIARLHTLRWLIEVFFEDWKLHEGWCNRALQQGVEGSKRGVILSVLCDHLLLLHPEQSARIERNEPALTVGSLVEKLKAEALVDTMKSVVESDDPKSRLSELIEALKDYCPERKSTKHMVGRDLGRLEPTPSLKYRLPEYRTYVL